MWKNFMTAIGLLAIALITALYSSSAGRDGRVVAAAISAFVALGIAVRQRKANLSVFFDSF
jgi:hypothetical protein